MSSGISLFLKRVFANLIDNGIELGGGFLGSYFGMMVAALLESTQDGPAEQLQSSMWSGFGFGFMFWTLGISFINRVLIQGLSRASIGKKIFQLELISTDQALSWGTILGRWTMGFGSLALGGSGFIYAVFDKDGRTFHDIAARTDVVPSYQTSSLAVEYRESKAAEMPSYGSSLRNAVVIPQNSAERPMATVIRLPVHAAIFNEELAVKSTVPNPMEKAVTLADVISLHPRTQSKDKLGSGDGNSGSSAA